MGVQDASASTVMALEWPKLIGLVPEAAGIPKRNGWRWCLISRMLQVETELQLPHFHTSVCVCFMKTSVSLYLCISASVFVYKYNLFSCSPCLSVFCRWCETRIWVTQILVSPDNRLVYSFCWATNLAQSSQIIFYAYHGRCIPGSSVFHFPKVIFPSLP
jgi:hypothetical protein